MKFITEQRGQTFFTINDTTKQVRGRFKEKKLADDYTKKVQAEHDDAIAHTKGTIAPPKADISEE